MIAVTNDLISSVVTDLDTDCEILWIQIDLIGTKSLHIGSFYRPPNSDTTALDNLNLSLERLTHRTNGNIWLGGDFNAPNIGRDRLASSGRGISSAGSRIVAHETIDQTETGRRWLTMFTFLRLQLKYKNG